jgi:hypothetical protein
MDWSDLISGIIGVVLGSGATFVWTRSSTKTTMKQRGGGAGSVTNQAGGDISGTSTRNS